MKRTRTNENRLLGWDQKKKKKMHTHNGGKMHKNTKMVGVCVGLPAIPGILLFVCTDEKSNKYKRLNCVYVCSMYVFSSPSLGGGAVGCKR